MSENVCPPIIQKHWVPLDFSQWAVVASKEPELLSEHLKRTVDTNPKPEAPGYIAITKAMRQFNEQQCPKTIFDSSQEIMERMIASEGKTSESQFKTMEYLRRLDRAGDPMDYLRQQCTIYKG